MRIMLFFSDSAFSTRPVYRYLRSYKQSALYRTHSRAKHGGADAQTFAFEGLKISQMAGPRRGPMCITAGGASMASGTCGCMYIPQRASLKRAKFAVDSLANGN